MHRNINVLAYLNFIILLSHFLIILLILITYFIIAPFHGLYIFIGL
jgi:hypothetical protein